MTFQSVEVNDKPDTSDSDAAAQSAALKAAADGGVVVNGETVVAPADEAPAGTERPANVPEKFWDAKEGKVNVEAVLASNQELQAQFTKEKQGEKPAETPADGEETPAVETPKTDNPIVDAQTAYDTNGKLEETHYEALEAAGLDRATVDNYIAGQEALANGIMDHAHSLTEGAENFAAMNQWASENMSEQELAAYNAQVTNAETSDYAISQLYAKFSEARPMETPLINGDNSTQVSGEYFKSAAEMAAAMSDVKYKQDPAFRKEVEQKIARADAAGVNLFV